jgi:hypothetical protein
MFQPILGRDERNLRKAPGRSGNSTGFTVIERMANEHVSSLTVAQAKGLKVPIKIKKRKDLTETKNALIWDVGRAPDHVPRVALGHLVIADVATLHPCTLELFKHGRDLRCAGGRLELEREEHVRALGGVVPVYKLCDGARVYDRV